MEQDSDDTIIRPRLPPGPMPGRQPEVPPDERADDDTVLTAREAGVPGRPLAPSRPIDVTVPWYRFRVNDHDPIVLDVPAYIGRTPGRPRVPQGRAPRLVRVPSPRQEVSGTHVELRQQGTSVIVTDLRSTNGTIVSLPGSRPRALRQGESLVVTPGTVVDIGDGNRIEILPIQRPSLPTVDPANRRLEL